LIDSFEVFIASGSAMGSFLFSDAPQNQFDSMIEDAMTGSILSYMVSNNSDKRSGV
jgi:hypothetical protein